MQNNRTSIFVCLSPQGAADQPHANILCPDENPQGLAILSMQSRVIVTRGAAD